MIAPPPAPAGHLSTASSGQPSQAASARLTPRRDGDNNLHLYEQQQQQQNFSDEQQHNSHRLQQHPAQQQHHSVQQQQPKQPLLHSSASAPSPSPVPVRPPTVAATLPPPQPEAQSVNESRYACFNCMPELPPLSTAPAPASSSEPASPSFIDKIRQRLSGGEAPPLFSNDEAVATQSQPVISASPAADIAALQAELAEARSALALERETVLQLRSMLTYKKLSASSAPNLPSMQASKLSLIAVNQLAGHVLGQLDCSGGDRPAPDAPNAVHMSNSIGTSRMILKSISRFVQSLASRFAPIDLDAYTRFKSNFQLHFLRA